MLQGALDVFGRDGLAGTRGGLEPRTAGQELQAAGQPATGLGELFGGGRVQCPCREPDGLEGLEQIALGFLQVQAPSVAWALKRE